MILQYKLDGRKVTKQEFFNAASSRELINRWETTIIKHEEELRQQSMCVILHWYNGELKVITETRMLMKLYCEVYKSMFFSNSKKENTFTDMPSMS